MLHLIFVIWLGWLVSFFGQLPLGTMSITSTQIAVSEGFKNAWKYSMGVALVEIIYVRLVLKGVDWILQHRIFFMILGWLTVVFFLSLGVASFISAAKQKEDKKALLLNNRLSRFFLGVTMSALNPAQIPFWFIWSSYVMDLHLLNSSTIEFNLFTLGCGIGTVSGLALYMYGGNYLITKMNASTKTMNKIMGVIFFIAGIAQLWRMLFEKVV